MCSAYLQYGVRAAAFMSSIIWVLTSLVTLNFECPIFYTWRCCWLLGVSRSSHMTWEDFPFHWCHLLWLVPFLSSPCTFLTRLWAGQCGVWLLAGARDVFFSTSLDQRWRPPSLLLKGYQGSFQYIKRLGHEVYPLHTSGAEIKNEWCCIFVLFFVPSWYGQEKHYTHFTYIWTNVSKFIGTV